jgi:sarcosine oxidase subunit alpha
MSAAPAGRLAGEGYGLLIDTAKPLTFTFDGKLCNAFDGDVIASALYAEGRVLLSRSFKYHRPRGVLTMAGHDANTLVQIAEEPNVRADRHRVSDGLAVRSINRLGSLDRDLLSGFEYLARFLPVGFYYKTFFRPDWAWRYWEKAIRAVAGLGRLDPRAHHKYYDKAYLFADVLVVGGGPAGLEAAIAAAEAGADTLLLDEWPEAGGSLLYARAAKGGPQWARRAALLEKARLLSGLRIMTATTVTGLFADNWASAIAGHRLYKIRAKHTVVAAGGFDQPLVFPNNDRPGIMFADAAQRLMRLYAVKPGTRAVVATANRFGYEAALDLLDAGIEVAAVVDLTANESEASAEVAARAVPILRGATLVDASGTRRVESVAVAEITGDGQASSAARWIAADLVLMSVGYAPALHLACHAGAKAVYEPATGMHCATALPQGISLAGSASGIWSEERVAAAARRAGARAAALARGEPTAGPPEPIDDPEAARITHRYPVFAGRRAKDFVDFDEDIQVKDIVDTLKGGYRDIQLVKRYSTVGFGPSQGRHAHLNTIRIVATETGSPPQAVGTTTYRPPLVPEKFAHLAGRAFEPTRLTPMHHRHLELGARMMIAGLWLRPAYYGAKEEAARAIAAEVLAVREGAGVIDVSTLGGLDIRGPEAAAFLERMYTWTYANLAVGRARYALMTDMAGVIVDDGVACRLHDRHFYVTATTGAVDQVYRTMTWFNAQWRMDTDIANVTAAYAGVNVAGPKAREVLARLATDMDFSPEAFPYMGVRTGHLAGIPVRILRVGFVGELGYEVHAPSGFGEALWDKVMEAGRPFALRPFGVEAQRILRLEKGHIIVGQDTDGLTNPAEAGMEWALAKRKPFYVGKRSIEMQLAKGLSRRLVGFTAADPDAPAPKECHLVIRDGSIVGRVTSVVRSPTLGKVIGLVYLPPALAAPGSEFEIRVDGGTMVRAVVVPTPFYDPENRRQEL